METIAFKRKIEEFISYGYGDGYGYGSGDGDGDGYGDGYGYGSGDGDGYGYGYGYGSGSGDGDGYGYGSGSGDGDGDGYGDGYGYGSGDGDGDGYGIKSINGHTVYNVDDTPTVFFNIKGNVAKCAILDCKTSLLPCFVVKGGGLFAHGSTLHEAHTALQAKLLKRKPIEERIADFKAEFESGKKYPASEFFKWHHILTGSCEFGRREFCRQRNIDLENGQYTVAEFIELTKNAYGGDVIKQIK